MRAPWQRASVIAVIGLVLLVLLCLATTTGYAVRSISVDETWQTLLELARDARIERESAARKAIEAADLQLGPWYCIGPFKDEEPGNLWRAFDHVFPPEKYMLADVRLETLKWPLYE